MGNEEKAMEVIRPYGEAEIEAHAAKVGGRHNLREIVVDTEDGFEYHYLVKKPTRSVIQSLTQYEQKRDIAAQQKVIMGCVLEGDKDAYENDGAIYAEIMEQMGKLNKEVRSKIKKL